MKSACKTLIIRQVLKVLVLTATKFVCQLLERFRDNYLLNIPSWTSTELLRIKLGLRCRQKLSYEVDENAKWRKLK